MSEVKWQRGFHKHHAGALNIQRDALAGRPGVRAERCPSHHGWQVLCLVPDGKEGAGARGQTDTYLFMAPVSEFQGKELQTLK